MSLSPNPGRRNHIFSQKKLNKKVFKSTILKHKNNQQIKAIERKIMESFEQRIQEFVRCIEDNNQTIKRLEQKLGHNQKLLNQRNKENKVQDNQNKQIVEQLIESQINNRLAIVSKKFSEMEEALVSNMFQQQHHTLFQLSEQPIKHSHITQNDFMKLKIEMDDKLKEIVQNCSKHNNQVIKKCWEIEEQIRINEQVVESLNIGMENMISKIFSLESTFKLISNKGQQFKSIYGMKIDHLKQELNTLNIEILNIHNSRGSMMKKKQNFFQQSSKQTSRSQLKPKQIISTRRFQQVLKQSQRYDKPKPLIQREYKPNSIRTSLTNMRKSILSKQQFSDISSVSSSVSFLPNPIFIPTRIRTNPSLQCSPKQQGKIKITTTLPLKSPAFSNHNFFKQKHQDSLIQFNQQSSFNITNQITSPFQQAQYISLIDQSNETRQGFTLSSKELISYLSCQQKIKQTIYHKNIVTPIIAYLDDGYIKKSNGAYLFDHQGNVFNCSKEEFMKLCRQNIFQQK